MLRKSLRPPKEAKALLHFRPEVLLLALVLTTGACRAPVPDDDDSQDDDDATEPPTPGPKDCLELEGPRFRDEGVERGLDVPMFDPSSLGQDLEGGRGNVLLRDFDGDGDLDILLNETAESIAIFENDGTGHFSIHPRLLGTAFRPPLAVGAADLDEDGLPELVLAGFGWAGIAPNLGGMTFGPAESFFEDSGDAFFGSLSLGDMDGDGDLDLLLPAQTVAKVDVELIEHRLFIFEDGVPVQERPLVLAGEPFDSQVGLLADIDGDADLDVLLLGDQGPTSAILVNEGVGADGFPELVDRTADLGFDLDLAAMGVDGADLNDDGLLDWCVTDIGPPRCWVSEGAGFVESGLALGLVPEDWLAPHGTTGWSNDFADLDNDGFVDHVQASAPFEDSLNYPDIAWRGSASGVFSDVSEEWGLGATDSHYGLATGDLDGDGFLDLVTAGPVNLPLLMMNTCTPEAWVSIAAPGPPGSPEGLGAVVELESSSSVQRRPISGPRAQGQGPALAHFGLGDEAGAVTARVRWPDGQEVTATGLELRAHHVISHPDR